MNVGVVGNPSYRDLKNILAHLAEVAPRLGVTLYTEEGIGPLWPEPAPPPLHPWGGTRAAVPGPGPPAAPPRAATRLPDHPGGRRDPVARGPDAQRRP